MTDDRPTLAAAVGAFPEGALWLAKHYDAQGRSGSDVAPIHAAYADLLSAVTASVAPTGEASAVDEARAALVAATRRIDPRRLLIERNGRLAAGALTLRGPLQDLIHALGVELADAITEAEEAELRGMS